MGEMNAEFVMIKQMAKAKKISCVAILKRAEKENWPFERINGRGDKRFYLNKLPAEIQAALASSGLITTKALPLLAPEAAFALANKVTEARDQKSEISGQRSGGGTMLPALRQAQDLVGFAEYRSSSDSWSDETALDMAVIRDPRVGKWVRIIQEAQRVPEGWGKKAWIADVASRNKTTVSTIYRMLDKYNKKSFAGLKHTKGPKQTPRTWTPDAINYWIGLVLKKEHRKISKDSLYSELVVEAKRRGWRIGSYESALWWAKLRITPQLLALQRGGVRALDNTLQPVPRDYSDCPPFDTVVGDQHKFDFWVMDEETGEVFRPEGFFLQDLRTRCFYGGAIDKKYDSYLIGLAMHMGVKVFGPFGNFYSDNGKPELSRYVMGILKDIRSLGMDAKQTVDVQLDGMEEDPELINPLAGIAGTHRKAIVRNAKAKMIEGTFSVLEGILRDHFFVPGYVKKLGGNQEENEVDQKEIEALAKAGKLLTYREGCLAVFRAMDYYNRIKPHRGVLREWTWRPKPKTATPMDCLKKCSEDGWKPVMLTDEAIDLVFLPRVNRTVDLGRITFNNEVYSDDRLIKLHGQRVEVRFDPMDPEWVLVFTLSTSSGQGEYLARALPLEYSSMKDMTLAQRKIEEKRRQRKGFLLEYRMLTSGIPDVREYSKVPLIEKAAAAIGQEKKKQIAENAEFNRVMTDEELAAAVAQEEEAQTLRQAQGAETRKKKLPARPKYFFVALDRYKWITKYEMAGGELDEADLTFKLDYESKMDEGQKEHWAVVREMGM